VAEAKDDFDRLTQRVSLVFWEFVIV
jgi:hypothetical protein